MKLKRNYRKLLRKEGDQLTKPDIGNVGEEENGQSAESKADMTGFYNDVFGNSQDNDDNDNGSENDSDDQVRIRPVAAKSSNEKTRKRDALTMHIDVDSSSDEDEDGDDNDSTADKPHSQPRKHFNPLAQIKAERERQQQEFEKMREEKERLRKEQEVGRKKYYAKRARERSMMTKRTSRGQPVMKNQIGRLLDKIQKST